MQTSLDPGKTDQTKQRLIKHIPFRWQLSDDELEDLRSRDFFVDRSMVGFDDWRQLSGFSEWDTISHQIALLAERVDREPENLVLLESLAHEVIKALAYSWADGSVRSLFAIAKYTIGILDDYSPERLSPIARRRTSWPSLVGLTDLKTERKNPDRKTTPQTHALREKLENLELGKKVPLKSLSLCEPNRIARLMIGTMLDNRRLLQNLRKAERLNPEEFRNHYKVTEFPEWAAKCRVPWNMRTRSEWFEIGWKAVLEATDGHPEKTRDFRALGQYRADKYDRETEEASKTLAKSGIKTKRHKSKSPLKDPKSRESEIRYGIKWRVSEAFSALAKFGAPADSKDNVPQIK